MKLKFYLRMVLVTMAALFIATGCDKTTEEPDGPAPDKDLTITVEVSAIKATTATVTVTPSNDVATYYAAVITKDYFDGLGSDKAYLQDEISFFKKESEKESMSLKAYLEKNLSRETSIVLKKELTPNTVYYAYAYGIKTDGTVTTAIIKTEFTTLADDPEPEGENFKITVTDITSTTAKVAVAPKDKVLPYYFDIITKADYDKLGGTPAGIPTYMTDLIAFYKTLPAYAGKTTAEVVAKICSVDDDDFDYDGLDSDMSYYVYACALALDGTATLSTVKEFKTLPADPSAGPELELMAMAGDDTGANTDTKAVFGMQSSTAVSGKYLLALKSEIDGILGKGATIDDIINEPTNGDAMTAEEIGYLVSEDGLGYTYSGLSPLTAYTMIVKVTDAAGKSTVKSVDVTTTAPSGPASDAYNAWLGTWTVKSTSSEVTKKSISMDITIAQKNVNVDYYIRGWSICKFRLESDLYGIAALQANGTMTFANDQYLFDIDGGTDGILKLKWTNRFSYTESGQLAYNTMGGTNFVPMTCTLDTGKTTATTVGYQGTHSAIGAWTVTGMEFFYFTNDGKYGTYEPAEGFTEDDYPVGPFTLTKKTGASAPAKSMGLNAATMRSVAVGKDMMAKAAVAASNIPQLSSALKLASMSKTSNGLGVKAFKAEMNASAFEAAPVSKSAEVTIYKAIPME